MSKRSDLKALYAEMVLGHSSGIVSGVYFDTINKSIRLTKPITLIKLYSHTMDTFDNMEYMVYAIPMIAVTEHYIELINDWYIEDESKKMVSEGSWKELGNIYSSTIQIGKV